MQKVLVLGAGKIGTLIAFLLSHSKDYYVYLADVSLTGRPDLEKIIAQSSNLETVILNAKNAAEIAEFLKKNPVQAIVPCLPYYYNIQIAELAKELKIHYFDLTEDTNTTATILNLAKDAGSLFVPQCGLAPGFISIVANDLMKHFSELDTVKLRVGALPTTSSNGLQYALTWSTEGLINEYGNPCQGIDNGEEVQLMPLDDLEEIQIDGSTYEAFNTSGGIGSLADTYANKVKNLNYKTIRYPGHCAKIKFLMNDLDLNHDRDTLKHILEHAIPKTDQDVVIVYVSVSGTKDNAFTEESYVKKFYPATIAGFTWSAIQMTTASALCTVLDTVLKKSKQATGHVRQEEFLLHDFTQNRFGKYYL
jgi:saccharopine dehydrogenase-like NADP-dependent oxidoreductase